MTQITGWSGTYTGGGGGTESGRPIRDVRTQSRPPVAPAGGSGGGADPSGATPGTYDIQPLNPAGSLTQAMQESEDGIAGLKNSLFGTSAPDAAGKHGGILGDTPILGDLLRAGSETVSNAGSALGQVVGGGAAVIGGGLEHVDLASDADHKALADQFAKLDDSPDKQAALDAIAKDPGATGHYMSKAVSAHMKELVTQGKTAPTLTSGMFHVPASGAETVDNILGVLGLTGRIAERAWSGVSTPGQVGYDRLGLIKQVGDGAAQFNEDRGLLGTGALAGQQTQGGLNDIEAIAYAKTKTGEWTDDEARDFLTANNQGFSHSTIANIAGNVAMDPQNLLLPLAVAGIARVGQVGARIASVTADATKAVSGIEESIRVATASGDTSRVAELTNDLGRAQRELKVVSEGAYKQGESVSKLNPLGHLAASEKATSIVKALYKTYEPLQQLHVDKALRVAKAVIDPLGSLSLHNPFRKQMLDLMVDDGVHNIIGAYGDVAHSRLMHALVDVTEGPTSPIADMVSEDIGTYSANVLRRVIARFQRDTALTHQMGDELVHSSVEDAVNGVNTASDAAGWNERMLREANAHRIYTWDAEADANLAERMADNYATKDAKGWGDWIKESGLSADQKSLLHAATYGRNTKRLLKAIETAKQSGTATGNIADKLHRVILINRRTLTSQGAQGVLDRIEKATTDAEKITEIEAAQKLYPELRNFTLDHTAKSRSAERFSEDLKRRLPVFPTQVMDDELTGLPDDLRKLHTENTYTLGLAPEDEYKWGLQRANVEGGKYAPTADVWVDHVAGNLAQGYRSAGRFVEQNLAGQPILGSVGKGVGRAIDYIDAGVHTMNRRITGTVIAESARNRFLQNSVAKYGKHGITEQVAKDIADKLDEAVANQDLVVRPSGFSSKQMWQFAKDVIPKSVRQSDFGPRELMHEMLDAYKGDMRYVGMTQQFSSRIKRVLAFDSNNASLLAEQAYPMLKYRLNVIFQAQEKIEPFILNAFRGITPAKSARSMSDADKATYVALERMQQRSLVANADHEMGEYAAQSVHGKSIEQLAQNGNTATGEIGNKLGQTWESLRDVRGVKQVNMLRTFRHGVAKDMKRAWEETHPGLWDQMYSEAARKAQKGVGGLDEDEFAISMLAENMIGNNVHVASTVEDRLGKVARQFGNVDHEAATATGHWLRPQTIGSLGKVDVNAVSRQLAFPVGRGGAVTKTEGDLRAGIAAGDITIEDVTQALRRVNADPDYIMRVKSALEFSYTGFINQAKRDFNVSDARMTQLEDIIANAAKEQDMTPVEYLSQIMVPNIGVGSQQATMGHLGEIMDILGPEGKKTEVASRAQLNVPVAGGGTEDQFVHQLASVFSAHLDPSAKLALIHAFKPELERAIGETNDLLIEDVNRLWTPEMQSQFEQHIMGDLAFNPANLADLHEAGLLRTVEDWDRVDPNREITLIRHDGATIPGTTSNFIGDGLRNAPDEVKRDILPIIGRIKGEHPNLNLKHVDIQDDITNYLDVGEDPFGVAGVTVETADGGDAIILNSRYFGKHPGYASYEDMKAGLAAENEQSRMLPEFERNTALGPMTTPRESVANAPFSALPSTVDTVRHEVGHVIDTSIQRRLEKLRKAGRTKTKEYRMLNKYGKFRDQFPDSLAAHRLSEYARENTEEAMAELQSIALHGTEEEALTKAREIDKATEAGAAAKMAGKSFGVAPDVKAPEDLDHFFNFVKTELPGYDLSNWESLSREWEGALQDADVVGAQLAKEDLDRESRLILKDIQAENNDIMRGHIADVKSLSKGPQTVEDAVKQVRQAMQDAGEFKPRPVNADFVAGPGGIMPNTAGNPDVVRATQMFHRWTTNVMADHLRNGVNASQANVLDKIAGIPTPHAVPYDFTQHQLLTTVTENMQAKWEDAHRLQYYARGRSMLERSINHPMFGIYPASYMWGKMLPEITRFIAREPFGLKTGAAAYTTMSVMRDVALQHEMDPEFGKNLDALGHSQSMFALGYMMPSWPWEASAAWPSWARELAQEGLDMQARQESGGFVGNKSGSQGLNAGQIIGKSTDLLNPVRALDGTVLKPLKELTGGANPQHALDAPVAAGDLSGPLTQAATSLRDLLGG